MTNTETTIDRARRENRVLFSVEIMGPGDEPFVDSFERLKRALSDVYREHDLLAVAIVDIDLDPPKPRSWWQRLIDWYRGTWGKKQ